MKYNCKLGIISIGLLALCIGCIDSANTVTNPRFEDEIYLKTGTHHLGENLIIPEGTTLIIEKGTKLIFKNGAQILSNGTVIALGTNQEPISFTGDSWSGVKLFGNDKASTSSELTWKRHATLDKIFDSKFKEQIGNGNIFVNCIFENIKYGNHYVSNVNNHRAAIEAYDTSLYVGDSVFRNISYVGGIQAKQSNAVIFGNSFLGNLMHKAIHTNKSAVVITNNEILQNHTPHDCNDGLWIINSTSIIINNQVGGKGDDGIDIKDGLSFIIDNYVYNNKDEGLDIDHEAIVLAYNNTISNNTWSGVLVSSGSEAILVSNSIIGNNDSGITLRNKAMALINDSEIKYNRLGIWAYFDITKEHDYCESYPQHKNDLSWLSNITRYNQNKLMVGTNNIVDNKKGQYRFDNLTLTQFNQDDNISDYFKEIGILDYDYAVIIDKVKSITASMEI